MKIVKIIGTIAKNKANNINIPYPQNVANLSVILISSLYTLCAKQLLGIIVKIITDKIIANNFNIKIPFFHFYPPL